MEHSKMFSSWNLPFKYKEESKPFLIYLISVIVKALIKF